MKEIPEELQAQMAAIAQAVEMVAEEWQKRAFEECLPTDSESFAADEAAATAALKLIGGLPEKAQGEMLAAFMGSRPMLSSFLWVVGMVLESTGLAKGVRGWSVICHAENGSAVFARVTRNGDPDATAPVGALVERKQ